MQEKIKGKKINKIDLATTTGIITAVTIVYVLSAKSCQAANLEQQLEVVGKLATTKFKTYGVSAASIAAGIWSLFQGNVRMAGVIIAIGVMLAYYLSWVEGGMAIS
jgi:hypothetical protein